MIFKTKRDIGDRVWMMYDNKPVELSVSYIKARQGTRAQTIEYTLSRVVVKQGREVVDSYEFCTRSEDSKQLFNTKEELVESLLKEQV